MILEAGEVALADVDLHLAFVQLAFAQLLAQFFARAAGRFGQAGAAIDDHPARG